MPSADGHVLIYSREVPCELRLEDGSGGPPKDVGRLEPVRVKILLLVSFLDKLPSTDQDASLFVEGGRRKSRQVKLRGACVRFPLLVDQPHDEPVTDAVRR